VWTDLKKDRVLISTPNHWQPQELPDSREGKEKRVELTGEKTAETGDEGRGGVLAGTPPGRHLARSRRRLLASRAASGASRLIFSSHRAVTVGFEPEGARRGLELSCGLSSGM
jgi:hypothetical protein